MVDLTPRKFYPPGNSFRYLLNSRLGGSQGRSGRLEVRLIQSSYMGFYQILWRSPNLVTIYCQIVLNNALSLQGVIESIVVYPFVVNRLTPNDPYMGRTAPLTFKRCILYIYSTNICTKYFKHALYSPFFSLQNAVCFIMLTCLVPVLFKFYIQDVLKLKK